MFILELKKHNFIYLFIYSIIKTDKILDLWNRSGVLVDILFINIRKLINYQSRELENSKQIKKICIKNSE